MFAVDTEYQVRVTSSVGNSSSEPGIKYFRNCDEIREHTSKYADEL